MSTGRRIVALGALLACAIAPLASARQLPQNLTLTLPAPANDFATFNAVTRALAGASTPYGIEGPAFDTRKPPVDFALGASDSLTIRAASADDALRQIAAANPRLRWSRDGALLVVRLGPERDGFLDQRVARYSVADVSPRGALEALLAALDPDRPAGFGIQGAGRPPAGREGESTARSGRPISVSLENATVLQVLNAVAAANGSLSWVVTYDPGLPRYETASIQFIEGGYRVTAASKVSLAPAVPGLSSDAGGLVAVPVTGDLRTMLQIYAQQTGARINMERVREPTNAPRPGPLGIPPVSLPRVPSVDAIARLVSFDSRYEAAERNGAYRVRPKRGVDGRLDILDQSQLEFAARGDSVDYVLDRIGVLLGGQGGAPFSMPLSLGGVTNRLALARLTPVTFTVPAGGTIADILDALCAAEGTLTWQLAHSPSSSQSVPQLQLAIASSVGWSYSRGVRLAGSAVPLRPAAPPAVPFPASLDRDIGRLPIGFSPVPGMAFVALGAFARLPLGVEIYPAATPDDDPRATRRIPPPIVLGPGRASDAMQLLLERLPEYVIQPGERVLSIAPRKLLDNPAHFMNVPLDAFEVRDVPIYRAVAMLRQRLDPAYPLSDGPALPTGASGAIAVTMTERTSAIFGKRVSLALRDATPREILNRLVAEHGELSWAVSYELRNPSMPVRVEEATAVVRLVPYAGAGFMAELAPAVDPSGTQPAGVVGGIPPGLPATPRVTVSLPLTTTMLPLLLPRLALATGTRIGAEIVVTATPPGASGSTGISGGVVGGVPGGVVLGGGAAIGTYDLTGLPMNEALDRIVGWLPEYAWSLDDGVYRIRPKGANAASDALDRKVEKFAGRYDDVAAAAGAIRDLLDSMLPRKPTSMPQVTSGSLSVPRVTPDMQKPIELNLANVTVREILDAMIRQHGRLSWIVDERHLGGGARGLQIRVQSVDGYTITAPMIVR